MNCRWQNGSASEVQPVFKYKASYILPLHCMWVLCLSALKVALSDSTATQFPNALKVSEVMMSKVMVSFFMCVFMYFFRSKNTINCYRLDDRLLTAIASMTGYLTAHVVIICAWMAISAEPVRKCINGSWRKRSRCACRRTLVQPASYCPEPVSV